MNKIHKLVWSALHTRWVAASEVASGVGRGSGLVRRLRRLGLAAAFVGSGALAQVAPTTLPQGGQVVQGQATLQGAGSSAAPVLNINQSSQRAVIDWQSFNLGAAATVNFNQPGAQSATLNRVRDVNPSQIFGRINATGQVTLLNPNGVYFSPSAVLDVGALTATTMQQSDADFMAGRAVFTRSGSTASVVNAGTLQARTGGYVALLAPEVRNEGLIVAQQGTVALASGEAVQLNFDPASRLTSLTVTPSQIAALVENRTAVQVGGGMILLSATAVNGLQGSVVNSGALSASSLVSKGGRIVLEGDAVTLAGTSAITATGATGGGTVLVGGDWQGAAGTHQATTVSMAAGATIDASATQQGDGGKVVLWSDLRDTNSLTTAQGRITARGGAAGGNGGQIETSGHAVTTEGVVVDAGAAKGTGGLWLIDPADATITQGVADSYRTTLNTGTSVLNDVAGNITWNSGVTLAKTAGGSATLTLRTSNSGSISLNNASITSNSNALNLVLWTRYNSEGNEGRISLNDSTISTNGGSVWMGGGNAAGSTWNGLIVGRERASTYSADQQGVNITNTSINTGAGNIQLKGLSYVTGSNTGTRNFGVWVDAGSSLSTTSGSIDLVGDVQGTYTSGLGVLVGTRSTAGNVTLASTSGAINIIGTATDQSGSGTGWRHGEMLVANNAGDQITVRSTSGAITLNGAANSTSSAFTTDSSGVQLQVGTTTGAINVVSQTGAISLQGSAALEGTNQTVDAIRLAAADAANSIRIGYDGSNPYSGNILLQGDSILQLNQQSGAGSISMQSSGTLTFQSAGSTFTYLRAGSSGTLTFDDDWNFGTSLSGLTIGKTTNTANLTLTNPLTVAGSVDITAGRIGLDASISKTSGGDATLTMRSLGDIVFTGAGINATSGKLNTVLISDWESANGGAIYLNGGPTPITINTNGGHFWAGGNGYAAAYGSALWNGVTVGAGTTVSFATTGVYEGVNLNRVTLNTAGGNVSIAGRNNRYNSGENRYGVLIQNGSSISSGSGSIAVNGSLEPQSGSLPSQPVIYGVSVANSTLQTTTGGISLTGSEGATNVSYNTGGYGIQLYNSTVKTTGSSGGDITLSGTTGTDPGGNTTTPRYGVQLFADGASKTTEVSSVAGNIAITGTANVNGSNSTSAGVQFKTAQPTNADATNPVVKVVSQTGNVTLTGDSPNNPNTGSTGIGFDGSSYGKLFVGFDGTNAYSGTTTLAGRGVTEANMAVGYLNLGGSGGLVIAPLGNSFVTGASAGQSLDFNSSWNFGSSHSGIRLGKDVAGAGKTDTITVSNALTAAGPISVYSGNIFLNANLTTTAAGAAILAKGSGNVITGNNQMLQTNGGDITLWADNDVAGGGYILLNESTKLDSRTAAARTANVESTNDTTASGGGNITLGGGNGATAAAGYALSAGTAERGGVNFGDQTFAHTNLTTIYSGGGNIVVRGQQTVGTMMGINWVNGGTLNAGTGTVSLNGISTAGHGIELASWRGTGSANIYAGGGSAGTLAITLTGTSSNTGGSNGVQIGLGSLQANGAGGISVVGSTANTAGRGVTGSFDALAASGAIGLDGGTYGISLTGTLGRKAGTNVTTSGSNVTLTGDSVAFGAASTVDTTGTLTVQPYGNNFSSTLAWPASNLSLGSNVSGLTLGKDLGSTGHTDTITVGSNTSIAGPINIYAGTINLNANLTTTLAGAGILAKASGNIVTTASKTFQTNNGELIFWSDSDASGAGNIQIGTGNTLNTANGATSQSSGGGRITLAGGMDDGGSSVTGGRTAGDGRPDGYAAAANTATSFDTGAGVSLGAGSSLYSGGGDVFVAGKSATSTAGSVQTSGIWFWSGLIDAGGGKLALYGKNIATNNSNNQNSFGIHLNTGSGNNTTTTLVSASSAADAITLVGDSSASTTTGSSGLLAYFSNAGGVGTRIAATNGGGITLTGSSSTGANATGTGALGDGIDLNFAQVLSTGGPITLNGTGGPYGISLGGRNASGNFVTLGQAAGVTVNGQSMAASSSNLVLNTDALLVNGGASSGWAGNVASSGTLVVQPIGASFVNALNWSGLGLSSSLSGLTLGKSGNTADITVNAAQTVNGPIALYGGNLALNAGLTATNGTVTLQGSGTVSDGASGFVSAANLLLLGGNVQLDSASTTIGTLAASGVGSVDVRNSSALSIGTVGSTSGISASGAVAVSTQSGDLTLAGPIGTSDASNSAIVLNAGRAEAAGTATGGNLLVSGSPTLTTGAGGRATLYSGSITGSTGLADLIGAGSGRFRYDSDEAVSHFTAALNAAAFAVYRERPTLTVTASNPTLTYGDTLPTLASAGGAVNGDVLAVNSSVGGSTSSSGHYTAGTHAITSTSADAIALGYAVSAPAGTLTVTPKALTISGIVAASKIYDGNTTAAVDTSGAAYAGLLSGDVVGVNANGSFADKNVGTAKTVTLTSNHTGADAGNYAFTDQVSTSADITPKNLIVTGSSAASKVYDRSSTAIVTGGTLQGVISGDAVTLTQAGDFASVNVGSAITVTANDSLGGAGAGNYTLTQPTGLAADITPKALTVTGTTVANKVYDRTTSASISGGILQGVVAGDLITLTQTGDFASASAGTGIAVTTSDALVGSAAGNYTLTQPTGLAADITPKALTVTGSAAANKVYDRTTAASISGGTLQGVIAGDTVTLTQAGDFIGANVGTGIAVTTSDTLGGSAAGNYTLTQPAGLSADITPKALTVTGSVAANKVYDRTTTASISGGSLQGVIAGDALTLTQAGDFASANAGTGIAVTASNTLGGSAAGNYTLTQPTGLSADITPKPLTLQGATGLVKTYDGRNDLHAAGFDPLTGVIAGDSVAVQGAATYAGANAGSQAIVQGSVALSGTSAANYTLGWTNGSGTITPAPLTITANNDARFVTQADAAGYAGVSYSGFVNGENAASALGGSTVVSRSNAGINAAGSYAGVLVPSGATAANYSIAFVPGSYTIVPANQLLVRVANTQTTYGTEAAYAVTEARYLASDNSTIVDLTGSVVTQGNVVTVTDGAGGTAHFTIAPANAVLSGAGALKAGSYQLTASAVTETSANFGNTLAVVGAQQVDPKGIALATSGATKVYDGSTAMNGLQFGAAGLAGDAVSASGQGAFSSRNAGTGLAYSVTGLQLAGADAGNYYLVGGSSQAGSDGVISPKAITFTAPSVSRAYDGSVLYVADAGTLATLGQGLVAGDVLSGLRLTFDDKNVGTGKTLVASDALIADGNHGANYRVRYVADRASSITRLASVTWVGGPTGNWFDPANWAGGAVPDLANVANVVIPANVVVSFGPPGADAPVRIDSLGSGGGLAMQGGQLDVGAGGVQLASLNQSGGSLSSQGDVAIGRFTQSDGTLAAAGNFSTTEAFGQTSAAGTLTVGGNARIVNTNGTTLLGNISSGSLSVNSSGGAIAQQPGTALVVPGSASFTAANGDGTPADIRLDAAGNQLSGTVNAGGANVTVVNGGPLTLGQVTASRDLVLRSQGSLVFGNTQVGGTLAADSHGGDVTQTGPLVVGGSTRIEAGAGKVQLLAPENHFGGGTQISAGTVIVFDPATAGARPASAAQVAGAIQVSLSARAEAAERVMRPADEPATVTQLQPVRSDSTGLVQVRLAPAPEGAGFTFELPAPTASALRQSTGTAVARLDDGGPLPDWLMFDAERLRFSAVAVPPGGLPVTVRVQMGALRVRVQIAR